MLNVTYVSSLIMIVVCLQVLMSESGRLQYATNFFRHDPAYATWIWGGVHPFLTTTVIPIIVICGLNFRVYR